MGLGSFGIPAQLIREAMILPSEDMLPVYRLQHGKSAPMRKCFVYNKNYAVTARRPPSSRSVNVGTHAR